MVGKTLRIAIAVVLTALVLYLSQPSKILGAVAGADLRWIGAAVALVFVDRTLMAMRWIELLVALAPGTRPPLGAVLRVFFVSSFVSNFVPSVGADLYRAYALSRYDVHLAESTASVLMDRALGVLSVVLVAAIALPFASVEGRAELVALLAIMSAVCCAAVAVIFSERAAHQIRALAGLVPVKLLHRVTAALTDAVRAYAAHHGALLRVLALSVLVQIFRVLQAWCLGRGLGIDLPLATYFAFIPLIVFIMQVPITPNGLGTTQLAFERFFVPQGAPPPNVFALSVLFLALGILGSLPGGILYALSDGRGRGTHGDDSRGTRGTHGDDSRGTRGTHGDDSRGTRGIHGDDGRGARGTHGDDSHGTRGTHGDDSRGTRGTHGDDGRGARGIRGIRGSGTSGV